MKKLFDRPTGDVLILLFAVTISVGMLSVIFALIIIRILHSERDLAQSINLLSDTINTMLGLIAGFIAGRAEGRRTNQTEPNSVLTVGTPAATMVVSEPPEREATADG